MEITTSYHVVRLLYNLDHDPIVNARRLDSRFWLLSFIIKTLKEPPKYLKLHLIVGGNIKRHKNTDNYSISEEKPQPSPGLSFTLGLVVGV